jgi:hypothetical protein
VAVLLVETSELVMTVVNLGLPANMNKNQNSNKI